MPTAFITGSSKRLGKNIALYLASLGFNILIHYNKSKEQAEELKFNIINSGMLAEVIYADFNNKSTINQMLYNLESHDNKDSIDILVNNASLFINDNIMNINYNSLQKHFSVNCAVPLVIINKLIQLRKKRIKNSINNQSCLSHNDQLNIINILDYGIYKIPHNFLSYNLSKQFLHYITKLVAKQTAPFARVNCIAPGPIYKNENQSEENYEKSRNNTLLGYGCNPEEINTAISMLLSCKSMTGQIITLDSGMHISDMPYS